VASTNLAHRAVFEIRYDTCMGREGIQIVYADDHEYLQLSTYLYQATTGSAKFDQRLPSNSKQFWKLDPAGSVGLKYDTPTEFLDMYVGSYLVVNAQSDASSYTNGSGKVWLEGKYQQDLQPHFQQTFVVEAAESNSSSVTVRMSHAMNTCSDSSGSWLRTGGVALGATIGISIAAPLVLGFLGFTTNGITAGSFAARAMSASAVTNGGGVAAGSPVAVAQSVVAAGVSTAIAPGVGVVAGITHRAATCTNANQHSKGGASEPQAFATADEIDEDAGAVASARAAAPKRKGRAQQRRAQKWKRSVQIPTDSDC
jgi:hypothetical protein